MKHIIISLLVFFTLLSCQKEAVNQSYQASFEISPYIEYVGPRPPAAADAPKNIPAMRVTDLRTKETFTLTLGEIKGFTFEEGFKYILIVEVTILANPPMDGDINEYTLVKIVSKEK